MKLAMVLLGALMGLAGAANAQECNRRQNTQGIVECIDAQTRASDKKLNMAYQALIQGQGDEQRERLRAAQRLWIQYRDANCGFYAGGDGSISRIEAADCMLKMTRARTLELERGELP